MCACDPGNILLLALRGDTEGCILYCVGRLGGRTWEDRGRTVRRARDEDRGRAVEQPWMHGRDAELDDMAH